MPAGLTAAGKSAQDNVPGTGSKCTRRYTPPYAPARSAVTDAVSAARKALLDEPTEGLDRQTARALLEISARPYPARPSSPPFTTARCATSRCPADATVRLA